MKPPIDIYKRYRKPKAYVSMAPMLTAVMTAIAAAQTHLIASQPINGVSSKAIDIALNTIRTFEGISNIYKQEPHRRFKATGRYKK